MFSGKDKVEIEHSGPATSESEEEEVETEVPFRSFEPFPIRHAPELECSEGASKHPRKASPSARGEFQ
jgi:hypothetical protein